MKNFLLNKTNKYFLILLTFFAFGCNGGTTKIESKDTYVIVIVEGCEYMYKEGVGYKSFVHKGNCKNEIHKCNCSKIK